MSPAVLAIIVSIWIICAIASCIIAANKGLSPGGYFLLGFLLGLIGLAIAMIAKPATQPASAPMPMQPPGWYPDPWGVAPQRYFDGQHWTTHTHGEIQPA